MRLGYWTVMVETYRFAPNKLCDYRVHAEEAGANEQLKAISGDTNGVALCLKKSTSLWRDIDLDSQVSTTQSRISRMSTYHTNTSQHLHHDVPRLV
jgi:hypothetical protein